MTKKNWTGLAILLAVAAIAFALDHIGREQQPRHYTIHFSSGLNMESGAGSTIDLVAARMRENPGYEALVKGHTGTRGDPAVNHDLSGDRAELIEEELTQKGIEADRIETFALGGTAPLKQLPDEGDRSYTRRLRRVEITLKQ
jgi:outer membrane protein OmpA-like peptidoglycan-associated protein